MSRQDGCLIVIVYNSGELDATFVARVKKAAELYFATPGRRVIIPTGFQAIGNLVVVDDNHS